MAEIESTHVKILFVPNIVRQQGAGHLRRCVDAVSSIGKTAAILLVHDWIENSIETFSESEIRTTNKVTFFSVQDRWSADFVVLDFQKTPSLVVERLMERNVPLVGWDEGGIWRSRIPYLVDSLPNLDDHEPNARKPELLQIPRPKFDSFEEKAQRLERVVVCFGGADPQFLTEKTVAWLEKTGWLSAKKVVVVQGPYAPKGLTFSPSVEVWNSIERLADRLGEFDLFLGSWGLTAMESLSNSTPVMTLNPSRYHEKLALEYGLPSVGVEEISESRWKKALATLATDSRCAAENLAPVTLSTSEFWSSFRAENSRCPVCFSTANPVIARTETKSYFHCQSCSMEYMTPFNLPPKVYSQSYFFDEYQKQYGKTYLEDFESIRSMGKSRLAQIQTDEGFWKDKTVFDIGCAYGPFLAAARDVGAHPVGLDISQHPVDYVRNELGFPALAKSILDLNWAQDFPNLKKPDVVTMWYVIEHFSDLDALLSKVAELLDEGGIFAFSTPHGEGISRLFSGQKFWNESPDDHFSIWNRSIAKKVLARYGFQVKRFRITGRHPERFPGIISRKGLLFKVVALFDLFFGWGDTFEVYAQKVRSN